MTTQKAIQDRHMLFAIALVAVLLLLVMTALLFPILVSSHYADSDPFNVTGEKLQESSVCPEGSAAPDGTCEASTHSGQGPPGAGE